MYRRIVLSVAAVFSLALVFPAAPLAAQEGNVAVFAPFVSRLRVAVRDPLVRITWEDIPDFSTSYQIYRSTREINQSNFSSATLLGEVDAGVQVYLDTPELAGTYYYAVVALDEARNPYRIFIPLRNITLVAVTIENPPQPEVVPETAPGIAAAQEPVQAEILGLSSISVEPRPDNQALLVSYVTDDQDQRVSIYRATRPIVDSESLSSALLVATQEDALNPRLTDYVVPGVPYYYAVVDADSLSADSASLTLGKTSLADPVVLPLGNQAVIRGSLFASGPRNPGLPLLNPSTSFISGRQLPPPVTTSVPAATAPSAQGRAAFELLASPFAEQAPAEVQPVLLDQDTAEGLVEDKAEARILESILRTEFSGEDWERTSMLLENLLTLPLEENRRARTEFYLGQSRFFAGNLEQAFLSFLLVQDELGTALVTPWMDAILKLLIRA